MELAYPPFEMTDEQGRPQGVSVKLGTTGHSYAVNKISRAKLLVLDKEDACVLEVVQGKADGFIYDQMSTFKNWQRHRETTRALLHPFQEEAWAVGLRQGRTNLVQNVNAFLKYHWNWARSSGIGRSFFKDLWRPS